MDAGVWRGLRFVAQAGSVVTSRRSLLHAKLLLPRLLGLQLELR